MADYNIYIHAIGTGGATNENPTVPWAQRESGGGLSPTASQTSGGGSSGVSAAYAVSRAAGFMQNPDSAVTSAVTFIAKASPWIAAAYAVTKVSIAIKETVTDFQTIETGNYTNQIAWQDLKQQISNLMHPFSSSLQAFKTQRQWTIENQKRTLQRDLLGDSVINSYTGRGV